ncbi:MAG: metallophosphoesterase family protein [Burkholderia contaminans]|jgi:3',5'-cyclic AMP phosphodiesterase CpdA|uniref:Metallophosphoesterase n=3 Tax=Burkholderia cepacia complex TaxID=87882 RepID=A4JEF1_BURVG|nr:MULTISPECIES: metallophosphoesterase [Burkholderia]ABO54654.1 metallophosphoesterase [Burkholderia vietnamiensis G4]HDR9762620.1 metallophosphoesterase [Burkholderia cepacia ATCC 25416]ABO59018.1 metallophosphoesterase [Burkholderia vietnamiensis G4]ABO59533.1 metallophosphoesterase [Burkholderia vietnamiensis G4]ABO60348.1 metallophosphoesterase [Burkholderia vietnamiensis G4]
MSSDLPSRPSRRSALKCLAFGGAGTLFVLSGGVLTPVELALAASSKDKAAASVVPLFLQISDSHIGFNKEANPDVAGTLKQTIDYVNAMPIKPALAIHTGDITHLSKPEEFDLAAQLLSGLNPITELHTVPGEHDVTDGPQGEYFKRFGKASDNRGYYSFDHNGVHFIGLVNVLHFAPNALGSLGEDQLSWLESDLKARSSSTPIVVFAHMPMWTIYAPWGWGTGDAGQAMSYLKRFGSVTVLNGHIHQIVSKVEGNVTFHTARSTAFPIPTAGNGPGPVPLTVASDQLPRMLGVTSIKISRHPLAATVSDTTLA